MPSTFKFGRRAQNFPELASFCHIIYPPLEVVTGTSVLAVLTSPEANWLGNIALFLWAISFKWTIKFACNYLNNHIKVNIGMYHEKNQSLNCVMELLKSHARFTHGWQTETSFVWTKTENGFWCKNIRFLRKIRELHRMKKKNNARK